MIHELGKQQWVFLELDSVSDCTTQKHNPQILVMACASKKIIDN
jgi:hypothetical protein